MIIIVIGVFSSVPSNRDQVNENLIFLISTTTLKSIATVIQSTAMSYNVALTVPANDQGLHYTVLYMTNVTINEIQVIEKHYSDMVRSKIALDQNGEYTLGYNERKRWGRDSDILLGPISEFKLLFNNLMNDLYPTKVSYRESHVDVKGDHDAYLYPSFNMMQYSIKKVSA